MTDNELEAIAREYAESNIPNGVDENYSRSIIYSDGEMFGRFLHWLSERFEIVSKDKIREEYESVSESVSEAIAKRKPYQESYFKGRRFGLKILFTQTLKQE